jgi:Domain of unknown function (DUF1906)
MRCAARIALIVLFLVAGIFILSGTHTRSQVATGEATPSAAYLGFDRNIYPGDDAFPVLRKTYAFTGYWLGPPPGEKINTWEGKRELLRSLGFGFALLYSGRQSRELKTETVAKGKGSLDARNAAAAAKTEGFAADSVIFLDIEEGGRLSPAYHAYLRNWFDELKSAGYRAGVYCSAIPANEGHGVTILTSDDIRHNAGDRKFVYWMYNDVCPPAPGCGAPKDPPAVSRGGVAYATIWQFAQSPRNKDRTTRCAATYAPDGNCYAPGDASHAWFLDVNSASSADPSAPTK